MAEYNVGIHEYSTEQCRRLLSRLPGVFAAGLRFESDQLIEIHILASTERNPKQIARDIQSALFAAYGIEVDHRIISIAQLPDDPFLTREELSAEEEEPAPCSHSGKPVRLLFAGIDSQLKDSVYQISVHLAYEGKIYTGESRCRDTTIQRNRAVAQACLNAVHEFLGHDPFSLLEVKQINVWGEPISITVLEYMGRNAPLVLIGAAIQPENASVGIVRSTLDALNRSLSKICEPSDKKH